MSRHSEINDLIPFYLTGELGLEQSREVEEHLAACPQCQDSLALWKAIARPVRGAGAPTTPPAGLVSRSLAVARARRKPPLLPHWMAILRTQIPLVRREIWPASAA
ncbi:MAG: zf-HC2 domain-containing protein, partial [Anaerolineaceae bacterium]|nr:zf-HC2 domain-containing protein [Anaerolineaceae bacterium]